MKRVLLAAIAAFALAENASASVFTIGTGVASECYQAATAERSDQAALRVCNLALDDQALMGRDRAATFVNRGIILLNRREASAALADFDAAIRLSARSGEAHVNRGAALILMRDYSGAIAAITHGITLEPDDPHKAYFNRAIANEELGDLRAAYGDFRRAAELAPDWALVQRELSRYTVSTR